MFWFLKQHGNFTLNEIYMLIPYEFEIYYYMTVADVKKKKEQQEAENKSQQAAYQKLKIR